MHPSECWTALPHSGHVAKPASISVELAAETGSGVGGGGTTASVDGSDGACSFLASSLSFILAV